MQMKRPPPNRFGASFIEVMAGLVLVAILFVPLYGILTACTRIWRQFEGGHGTTANRQMAMQECERRLRSAKLLESYDAQSIVYVDVSGVKNRIAIKQRMKPNGLGVFDLVRETLSGAPQTEVLAEDIGTLSVALVRQTPAAGQLLEIRLENVVVPGVTTPRRHSSRYVWKRA